MEVVVEAIGGENVVASLTLEQLLSTTFFINSTGAYSITSITGVTLTLRGVSKYGWGGYYARKHLKIGGQDFNVTFALCKYPLPCALLYFLVRIFSPPLMYSPFCSYPLYHFSVFFLLVITTALYLIPYKHQRASDAERKWMRDHPDVYSPDKTIWIEGVKTTFPDDEIPRKIFMSLYNSSQVDLGSGLRPSDKDNVAWWLKRMSLTHMKRLKLEQRAGGVAALGGLSGGGEAVGTGGEGDDDCKQSFDVDDEEDENAPEADELFEGGKEEEDEEEEKGGGAESAESGAMDLDDDEEPCPVEYSKRKLAIFQRVLHNAQSVFVGPDGSRDMYIFPGTANKRFNELLQKLEVILPFKLRAGPGIFKDIIMDGLCGEHCTRSLFIASYRPLDSEILDFIIECVKKDFRQQCCVRILVDVHAVRTSAVVRKFVLESLELQEAGHNISVAVHDCVTRLMNGSIFHSKLISSGRIGGGDSTNMTTASLYANVELFSLYDPEALRFVHCIYFPFHLGWYANVIGNVLSEGNFDQSGFLIADWPQVVNPERRQLLFLELEAALTRFCSSSLSKQEQEHEHEHEHEHPGTLAYLSELSLVWRMALALPLLVDPKTEPSHSSLPGAFFTSSYSSTASPSASIPFSGSGRGGTTGTALSIDTTLEASESEKDKTSPVPSSETSPVPGSKTSPPLNASSSLSPERPRATNEDIVYAPSAHDTATSSSSSSNQLSVAPSVLRQSVNSTIPQNPANFSDGESSQADIDEWERLFKDTMDKATDEYTADAAAAGGGLQGSSNSTSNASSLAERISVLPLLPSSLLTESVGGTCASAVSLAYLQLIGDADGGNLLRSELEVALISELRLAGLVHGVEMLALPALMDILDLTSIEHLVQTNEGTPSQVLTMIREAQAGELVVIISPNVTAVDDLCDAGKRGVSVIVINSRLGGAGKAKIDKKLRAAKIVVITLDEGDAVSGRGILHLKMYARLQDSVENATVWHGTANITKFGFFNNKGEYLVHTFDAKTALALVTIILATDLGKSEDLLEMLDIDRL